MQNPDQAAAQAFLAEHTFVRSVAIRAAPWPDLVDDIVQQVFLEFMRKSGQWDLERGLRPLLATMTRMVALRHWRTATRNQPETVRKLAEHLRQLAESSDDDAPIEDHEISALHRCLRDLPDRSRTIVELHYFSGLSTREIGKQIKMKPDTECRALSRVRDSLRRCLQKVHIHPIHHG